MVCLEVVDGLSTDLRSSVEVVFESSFPTSFSFTSALFGAVVTLYHVNDVFGVTVNVISDRSGFACSVECVRKFVRHICIYKARQYFPHPGLVPQEPQGWLCCVGLRSFGPN